ncbi:MAG TPA: MATE family efflux transporter [Kofleriaceae bacterium]|nr:MATE family efflux transporter [Kofleriaceae bacterium]
MREHIIERARLRRILALALPIIGAMVSQNVLNLVDTFMVSRLGAAAIAAVGIGNFANFMAMAFVTGLSAGVQAAAARRVGEGRLGEAAVPLNGGLLLVVAIAVPLTVISIALTPVLFPLLVDDPQVQAIGIPYLQARLAGMVAVGANFSFRGYWNGVGQSGFYLRTLLLMHAANVLFSYTLIFGAFGAPALGATGAGIGTTAATFLGTLYYVWLGKLHASDAGFLHGMPARAQMRSMVQVSVPSGVMQLFFAAGLTAQFVIVGRIGTAELAAATVLINLILVVLLPGLGLGLAGASLVGQALGRGDADDATAWGWDVCRIAAVVMGTLGLPMLLAPHAILSPFFDAGEPTEAAALAAAVDPLRLVGATMAIEAIATVLLNTVIGAGATRTALVVSVILQWFLFLPVAFLVGPFGGGGLMAVWLAYAGYRALQAAIFAWLWRSRRWAHISL